MTAISVEEQTAIRDSFSRLLSERSTEADVRRVMETEAGYDPALWAAMAEMGLTGLIVPAEYGGAGAGAVELEMLMEEAGAALLCAPYLSSAVLAASLLAHSSDAAAKARLLPQIASGERITTVALTGEKGLWTPEDVTVTASATGEGWRLDGVAGFVTYGAQADSLLAIARTPAGLAAFEVDSNRPGVTRSALQTLDRTQRLARIEFHGAAGAPIAGADAEVLEKTLDLARVALAGEQAGAARRVFDFTLEYLKTRVQFGRPIGGFQALKHMAADLLVEVESATSAARQAAKALAQDAGDAKALVNLAAFACADAFSQVAATSIQMHGGIAFTWDHPAHLYLRRARADAQLLGASDLYRDRYLSVLETANG
jgi:alkylation response protein AidB-like acyl-CoA dehydrogenase